MPNKIQSIEDNKQKASTRKAIVEQIVAYALGKGLTHVHYAGLPAENWLFEKMLAKELKKHGITLSGVGFEKDIQNSHLWIKMRNNCIPNFIAKNEFIDEADLSEFDVVWFDFCGQVNEKRRNAVKEFIRSRKERLVFATYKFNCRTEGGNDKLSKETWPFGKLLPLDQAIFKRTKFDVNFNKMGVKPLLNIIYAGGSRNVSSMITLGFIRSNVHVDFVEKDMLTKIRQQNTIPTQKELDEDELSDVEICLKEDVIDLEKLKILNEQIQQLEKQKNAMRVYKGNKVVIRELLQKGFTHNQIMKYFEESNEAYCNENGVDAYSRKGFGWSKQRIAQNIRHMKKELDVS